MRPQSRPSSEQRQRSATRRTANTGVARATSVDLSSFSRCVPVPLECTLWDLIAEKTGRTLAPQQFRAWKKSRDDERRHKIAAMRALGKASRASRDSAKDSISVVGLMSGHTEPIIETPRWNAFPWVARSHRREFLINLTFYLSHRPNCRHLRLTLGPRVRLNEIGITMQALAKAISRLNTRPWFKTCAEVASRSCELTWNGATAHVHAHIVVRPLVDLSDADWISLQGQVRDHCKGDTGDFEPVQDVAEVAPYFAKADSLDGLDGDEIRTYAEQLRHVRTHEPLGEFRAFCSELRRTNTKLVRRGRWIARVSRSDGLRRAPAVALPPRSTGKDRPQNQVVRLGAPRPTASRALEAAIYVRDYDGDFEALLAANPSLSAIRNKLMPQWPAGPRPNGGPPPIVPCTLQLSDQAPTSTSPAASSSRTAAATIQRRCGSRQHDPRPPLDRSVSKPSPARRPSPATSAPVGGITSEDDVAISPDPHSPFLRSELDAYRHFLEE
jgi:hypothetical protein